MTEVLAHTGTLLLAALWLLLPGWLVLRLVGVRGSFAAALAPAVSIAVLGCGAVLAQLVGVRWGLLAAVGASALGVGVALVVRVLAPSGPHTPPWTRTGVIGVVAGLLLAIVPALVVSGGDAYLQRWDAVFHLAALRFIDESGSASSLTLGALSYGDGHAAVYPAGWHALASLLPGTPTAVLVLGSVVTAALPWVLGCAVLAGELARTAGLDAARARAAVGVGGLLAGIATATPMSLWIGWGHVPNAAGLAMLPAVVALGLRLLSRREGRGTGALVLGVAMVGMALAHPNAALAAGALLLPALTAAVVRRSRTALASGRRTQTILTPMLAVAVVIAVVAAFLLSPLSAAVTGYTGGQTQSIVGSVSDVLLGRYALWRSTAGVVIGLVALAGAVVAVWRRRFVVPAMLAIAAVLYVDGATGAHLHLASLWYSSAARLSVVVAAVAVPLAALTLVHAVATARARWPRLHPTAVAAVAAVAVVALCVSPVLTTARRGGAVFEDSPGHPPQFVTTGELAMIRTLPDLLDGAVLGSPFSGTSSAYGLVGVDVVFPVAGQVWSPDQQLIMDHLDEIATGTAPVDVCEALDRLDVRYLYQDTVPYQVDHRYEPLDALAIPDAHVIAQADTARVLALPRC